MEGLRLNEGILPAGTAARADQGAMDAVREFLMEMTSKFEFVFTRCSISPQNQRIPNERRTFPSSGVSYGSVGHIMLDAFSPDTAHVAIDGARTAQLDNLISENCFLEEAARKNRDGTEEDNDINGGEGVSNYYGDAKLGDDLRNLLEDINKVLRSWSVRHSLISTRQAVNINSALETDATAGFNANALVLKQLAFDDEEDSTQTEVLAMPDRRADDASQEEQNAVLTTQEVETLHVLPSHTQTGFSPPNLALRNEASPEENSEMQGTTTSHDPRFEVVESPDWLPKGWITELKLRCTGNSAGLRDKYFFDPISKRRFRSKKEVFSFLTTGKLGRYKSRAKLKPMKRLSDLSASASELGTKWEARDMDMVLESMPSPHNISPLCVSTGFGPSNVFLSQRAGQPSEWHMYDDLGDSKRPIFECYRLSEYHTSKSNKDFQWQWTLGSDSGAAHRPRMDKCNMTNITGSNRNGQQSVYYRSGEAWTFMPKHARKSSKRK